MKTIYMECTLNLIAQDKQNHGFLQNLLSTSKHCATSDGTVKYIKIEEQN